MSALVSLLARAVLFAQANRHAAVDIVLFFLFLLLMADGGSLMCCASAIRAEVRG